LINAIFTSTNDATLTEILTDANNGAQVIGKIIAISSLAQTDKDTMLEATRRVLPNLKASSTPPYRHLLEAVGLPVPAGHIGQPPFNAAKWPNPVNPATGQRHPALGAGFGGYGNNSSPHGAYPQNRGISQGQQQMMYAPMAASNGHSSLLSPQNMPLSQAIRTGSPNLNGSPRTPVARQRGRMSPGSQMMSPGSDPFNPVCARMRVVEP